MINETKAFQQLMDTIENEQNFCVIEQRKAPILFEVLQNSMDSINNQCLFDQCTDDDFVAQCRFNGDYSWEIIVGHQGDIDNYIDLLGRRSEFSRYAFQVAMGMALGYSHESCIDFASDPVDCECEKCGGYEGTDDLKAREQWVALGAPNPFAFVSSNKNADKVIAVNGYDPEFPLNSDLYLNGRSYGTLMSVDPEAIARNPSIQPWSKPA